MNGKQKRAISVKYASEISIHSAEGNYTIFLISATSGLLRYARQGVAKPHSRMQSILGSLRRSAPIRSSIPDGKSRREANKQRISSESRNESPELILSPDVLDSTSLISYLNNLNENQCLKKFDNPLLFIYKLINHFIYFHYPFPCIIVLNKHLKISIFNIAKVQSEWTTIFEEEGLCPGGQ